MPIQQIGGRNVYIITGTNTDPSKTSTGQSWANLVTQQKYQIFKDVQEEALRQFQQQATDYQSQVEFAEAQREKLRKEIAATRKAIESVKDKERVENARRQRDTVREQNRRGRGESIRITEPSESTSSGGGGGDFYGRQEALGLYDRQINSLQDQATFLLDKAAKFSKEHKESDLLPDSIKTVPELQTMETYGEYIDYLNQEGVRQSNLALQLSTKRENLSDKQDAEFQQEAIAQFGPKRGGRGGSGGRSGSESRTFKQGEQPIQVAEPVTYDVTPQQEKIKRLEAELLGIQDPTAPTDSVIDLRRQIYQDKYLGQPQTEEQPVQQPVQQDVNRRAESQVLGEPTQQIQAESMPAEVVEPAVAPRVEDLMEPTSIRTPITTQTTDDGLVSKAAFEDVQIGEPVPDTPQSPVQDLIDRGDAAMPTVFEPEETIDPADVALGEGRVSVPEAAPAPMPTAPSDFASRFSRIGRQMNLKDLLNMGPTVSKPPPLSARFADVTNLSNDAKRIRAMELLEESKAQFGVTSKEYEKFKAQVLKELQKQIDPTKARRLKKVRKNQEEAPANYFNLGTMVSGVNDETRRLVSSLFPVTDDTRVDEIESLYKNAQQQIRLAVKNKSQKRKALELLDLQYLAVLEDKR